MLLSAGPASWLGLPSTEGQGARRGSRHAAQSVLRSHAQIPSSQAPCVLGPMRGGHSGWRPGDRAGSPRAEALAVLGWPPAMGTTAPSPGRHTGRHPSQAGDRTGDPPSVHTAAKFRVSEEVGVVLPSSPLPPQQPRVRLLSQTMNAAPGKNRLPAPTDPDPEPCTTAAWASPTLPDAPGTPGLCGH